MVKTSSAPSYREAYPRFDVIQAQAAMEREPSVCVFTLNNLVIGHLIIASSEASSVTIAYIVYARHIPHCEGTITFTMHFTRNTVHFDRVTIECAICGSKKY